MRILIVGSTYPPHTNGQSIFTANLAEGLVKRGHEVMVFKPSEHEQPYHSECNGVRVVAIRALHPVLISDDLYLALFYRKTVWDIFDTFQPEAVHLQDSAPICRYVAQVAHQRGMKVVATHHIGPEVGAPLFTGLAKWQRLSLNSVVWTWLLSYLNHMDLVVAPSKASVKMLKAHGLLVPALSLSCGVNLNNFHQYNLFSPESIRRRYCLDPEKKVFLYVGRLDYEKRVDVLVKAMSLVTDTGIQLAIAGKGAIEEKLKSLADEFNLGSKVKFLGHIPHEELNQLINCTDVFVMPGDAESLSIATLEAMACEKPVLAVDAMALPELITPGVNGALFKPSDPEDAARAIMSLAQQEEHWQAMGKANLEKLAVHDIDYVLSAYERIYNHMAVDVPAPTRQSRFSITAFLEKVRVHSFFQRDWLNSTVKIPPHIQILILLGLILLGSIYLYSHSLSDPTLYLNNFTAFSDGSFNLGTILPPDTPFDFW